MASNIEDIPFDELVKGFKSLQQRMPRMVASTAVIHFKASFRRQGWVYNGRLQRWAPRKPGARRNSGRSILVDKGTLRKSIRPLRVTPQLVEVGSTLDYAAAHNEGAHITGTAAVPAHSRRSHRVKGHSRSGRRVKAHQRAAHRVGAHSRKMNTRLPQRQFIGESPDVLKKLERKIQREVDAMITQL